MARLFISADQMERWNQEGKVVISEDVMTLPALGRAFRLRASVRFVSVIDGEDHHRLVGRIKTEEQLAEIGGEHYGASVIVGESGYECEEGFIGRPIDEVGDETGSSGTSGLLKLG
jgi:hypothetical protein